MREYTDAYPTAYANLGNGQPATLFSSYDQQTVDTHFRWMQREQHRHRRPATVQPTRGSWLELWLTKRARVYVRIDRKRKLPVTVLPRAMGYVENEQLLKMFDNSVYLSHTIDSDTEENKTEEGALIELFKKQRPGEPPSVDAARNLLDSCSSTPSATT